MAQTVILASHSQRFFAKTLIDKAPANAVVSVRLANRSNDQNAKFWALLSDISRAMPEGRKHTPEVWKLLVMHACGHAVQFELGINGQPFPVGFSSSKLTVAQMAELITWVIQYGDEHGVPWTDPTMTNYESHDDASPRVVEPPDGPARSSGANRRTENA